MYFSDSLLVPGSSTAAYPYSKGIKISFSDCYFYSYSSASEPPRRDKNPEKSTGKYCTNCIYNWQTDIFKEAIIANEAHKQNHKKQTGPAIALQLLRRGVVFQTWHNKSFSVLKHKVIKILRYYFMLRDFKLQTSRTEPIHLKCVFC